MPPPVALITGASGYIGHHLAARLLRTGWEVHAVARSTSDLRGLNVHRHDWDESYTSMLGAVRESSPDIVFHLASMAVGECPGEKIASLLSANITFGVQLLEAMAQHDCRRLVSAGSYWEYAADGSYDPNTLYAASKRAFADFIPFYCRFHGLCAMTLTLFDVYGPDDWRGKLLSLLRAAASDGRVVALSPGEQVTEMTHVSDVAAGFVRAADLLAQQERPGYLTYALGGGERNTLREVIQAAEQAWGVRINASWGAVPYRSNQIMQPVTTLQTLPGWRAEISLSKGLKSVGAGGDRA